MNNNKKIKKIRRMIKFENCHWQLNSTGSESDMNLIIFVYVTRISVIFIYALGFLFLPENLTPAAGNISNFIFLRRLH